MKMKWMLTLGGLMWGLALLAGVPGCEGTGNPDTGGIDAYFASHPFVSDPRLPGAPVDMTVTPVSAAVSFIGQQVSFTGSGGRPPYHWDVANGNGSVAGSPGDGLQGVYTATTLAGNSVIVYDELGHSAIATVGTGTASALAVTPNSAVLTNNSQVIAFSVTGGTPPYTWTVLNGHGGLNTLSGASVLYTRFSAGDNGLTAADSAGATTSVVIQQP